MKAMNKQDRDLLISIALRNRSILTLILDHYDSSIRNVPGAHAALDHVRALREKVAALKEERDPSAPYWDLEWWY